MVISYLHPDAVVREAAAGRATFACATIPKGEIVIIQGGQIMENGRLKDGPMAAYSEHCFQIERDYAICPLEPRDEALDGVFLVNHSCEPTCGVKGQVTLVALRNIQGGEEITFDYAMTDSNWGDAVSENIECWCGAATCRKIITGNDWRLPELQKRYKGYFSTYLQNLIESGV